MSCRLKTIFLILFCLAAASCSTTPRIPITYDPSEEAVLWPSEDLKERVLEYWSLRFDGEYEKAMAMEAPYLQEVVPMPMYLKAVKPEDRTLTKMTIFRLDLKNSSYYEVVMQLTFQTNKGSAKTVYLADKWVMAGQTWYHVIKDPIMRRFFP